MRNINDMKYEEILYKHTNREKTQIPKKSAGWCAGCDANHITGYEKCPICGVRNRNFTLKKESNA